MSGPRSPEPFLLFANLKMYFGHRETLTWVEQVTRHLERWSPAARERIRLAVFPSFPALQESLEVMEPAGISLGAQDVAASDEGAQTGEVSGRQLVEVGCRYVVVGHAERRAEFGETDEVVARKLRVAVRHGLVPLLCVGEREPMSVPRASEVVTAQLRSALDEVRRDAGGLDELVIAYEPVWAIGKESPAPREHISGVVAGLRAAADADPFVTRCAVLYGGSVDVDTVPKLRGDVDGVFLGRFVHDPAAFAQIIEGIIGPAAEAKGA